MTDYAQMAKDLTEINAKSHLLGKKLSQMSQQILIIWGDIADLQTSLSNIQNELLKTDKERADQADGAGNDS